jgi:cyclophilin family peptidyl-prolyl cis-trans isomerase
MLAGWTKAIGKILLCSGTLLAFMGTLAQAANDNPQVLLRTTKGDVILELYEDKAPNTVANFIYLVERKFYDGLTFHRVIDGFMAQGGDPSGNGTGGPGYRIACECRLPNAERNYTGAISMAHAGRDTGGSQFFLLFNDAPFLDGKHTVFGHVIQGRTAVDQLQRIDPEKPTGVQPDRILEARVIKKRNHPYVPQTLPVKSRF